MTESEMKKSKLRTALEADGSLERMKKQLRRQVMSQALGAMLFDLVEGDDSEIEIAVETGQERISEAVNMVRVMWRSPGVRDSIRYGNDAQSAFRVEYALNELCEAVEEYEKAEGAKET